MQRKILIAAGFFGMLAVILGAFGAHALKSKLSADQLVTYHTGIEYQFYHTLALLGLGAVIQKNEHLVWLYRAALCFIVGILFFSGSIYLLACRELLSLQNWTKFIGPITPIGGLFFIIGWSMILMHALTEKPSNG